MILWLNGPHGVGKSSVARRLLRMGPGRRLFDPERIGRALLQRHAGERPDDFKALPAWREQTVAALRTAHDRSPLPTVIVPMTLTDPDHHAEIIGALRRDGIVVCHVTLAAQPETLRGRIAGRIDWPRSKRWAMARVDEGAAAVTGDLFAPHVWTDELSLREVAEAVERHVRAATPPRS